MVKEEGWIKCDSPFYSALIAMVYNAYRWVWITLIIRHLKDHTVFKTSVLKEATPLPMITIMALQKGCPEAQDSAVPRDPAQVPGPRLPRPLPRHQPVYVNRGQRLSGPAPGHSLRLHQAVEHGCLLLAQLVQLLLHLDGLPL